jgi:hexosaminidase
MNKWVDRLVSDAEDTESADALRHVFNRWQSNTSDALALSGSNYQLKAIKPVIQEVDKLASIGLRLPIWWRVRDAG